MSSFFVNIKWKYFWIRKYMKEIRNTKNKMLYTIISFRNFDLVFGKKISAFLSKLFLFKVFKLLLQIYHSPWENQKTKRWLFNAIIFYTALFCNILDYLCYMRHTSSFEFWGCFTIIDMSKVINTIHAKITQEFSLKYNFSLCSVSCSKQKFIC